MKLGTGGVFDVDAGADVDGLLLDESRVVVVLMNGTQGCLGVFRETVARTNKNELSAQRLTNGRDKGDILSIKETSQWICKCWERKAKAKSLVPLF